MLKTLIACLYVTSVALADDIETYDISLDDSYLTGSFSGFDSVSFTLSCDESVDFWVVDEDGYREWDDNETPATTRLFRNTYCNDCFSHSTDFTPPSSTATYHFIVSALFPETTPAGQIIVTYVGSGTYTQAEEEEDTYSCFAADSTLRLKSGSVVPVQDARVGDEVLSATYSGSLEYSPIVHIPHLKNKHHAHFVQLTIGGSEDHISMTRDHLIPVCETANKYASSDSCRLCGSADLAPHGLLMAKYVTSGHCVALAEANNASFIVWKAVYNATHYSSRDGTYSVVTMAPFPVVNGFVSSSFGVSHVFPRAFYVLHRTAHWLGIRNNRYVSFFLAQLTRLFDYAISNAAIRSISKDIMNFAADTIYSDL